MVKYIIYIYIHISYIYHIYIIYHISYIIYHISYIIYHISYIIYHISYIIYHISYIIYHISYIIYHISYIIYILQPSLVYSNPQKKMPKSVKAGAYFDDVSSPQPEPHSGNPPRARRRSRACHSPGTSEVSGN